MFHEHPMCLGAKVHELKNTWRWWCAIVIYSKLTLKSHQPSLFSLVESCLTHLWDSPIGSNPTLSLFIGFIYIYIYIYENYANMQHWGIIKEIKTQKGFFQVKSALTLNNAHFMHCNSALPLMFENALR